MSQGERWWQRYNWDAALNYALIFASAGLGLTSIVLHHMGR